MAGAPVKPRQRGSRRARQPTTTRPAPLPPSLPARSIGARNSETRQCASEPCGHLSPPPPHAASVESAGREPRLGQVLRDHAVGHCPKRRAPDAARRFDLGFRARLANIGKQMVIEAEPDWIRPAEGAAGDAENALDDRRDRSIASPGGKSVSGLWTGWQSSGWRTSQALLSLGEEEHARALWLVGNELISCRTLAILMHGRDAGTRSRPPAHAHSDR